MIRVLVAEDSPTARALLVAMLDADPGIQVVAQASTGLEAVEMAERLEPDLITMDVHMPELDGLQATERIMLRSPRPIIIVSSHARDADVSLSLDATRAGALLVLPKPEGPGSGHFDSDQRQLVAMVKALSHVKVVRRWRGSGSIAGPTIEGKARPASRRNPASVRSGGRPSATLVAIAASTGGPAALKDTLAMLPKNFAAPILIVQHIAKGFVDGLAKWLGTDSPLSVRVAVHGETPLPGSVYVAPDGLHMELRKARTEQVRIVLTSTPPVGTFRPSASRLFSSVASSVGERALAVIMTGMGDDGVAGLLEVRRSRGFVLAQDEASSVIYGMPREAVRAGVVDEIVSLQTLPDRLVELT
ncbi:MAG TPA: chemotaxis-specific protein-glutamate methyltransferase CheB [Gemmatimonadaceae bacterium]|nr:chemotaxis-specific protein-glutamate methyltransferase CheB [Gemmatimonadaceae bacterium]